MMAPACSLCPTCKHYEYHSGSSNPHRCHKGSSLVIQEAKNSGGCVSYSPK